MPQDTTLAKVAEQEETGSIHGSQHSTRSVLVPGGDEDEREGREEGHDEEEEIDGENAECREIGMLPDMSESAMALKAELDKIRVPCHKLPVEEPPEVFDTTEFPTSYKENSKKEKLALQYVDNFRRQFVHLYPDRKPLFLSPFNECGLEKFVCTTIRPTRLSYKDLYDWYGAAQFVADYLNYLPLKVQYELPTRMLSPTTTLKLQRGNCFEYSTILVSLLIGAGYDAYVVNGYATKEVCLMDETREICPLLIEKPPPPAAEVKVEQKKYTVRPPKDLTSKYIIKMEKRRLQAIADEEEKLRKEEEERILESEKPPLDSLSGLRIHSWVIVLAGKREVPYHFFIEPLTGLSHPIDHPAYLGIEAVWNHQNYWMNMQECSEGVQKLSFDLSDCARWEFLMVSNDMPQLLLPDENTDLTEDEEAVINSQIEKNLDVPPSWVHPLTISQVEYELRCPGGKKTKFYKRAKLDKYALYLMKDGLICRLSVYEDLSMAVLIQVKEYYHQRIDKLKERVSNYQTGWITEFFLPGRPKALKEHHYKAISPLPENDRTMVFYDEARVDGLQKRIETPTEMTEHYVDRDDLLYYRYAEFGKRQKKFGPAEETHRPILKMIERYRRNVNKPANDDMAEIKYNVAEERISVTYHRDNSKIAASTREFTKPSSEEEKGSSIPWNPDHHITFQVDPMSKDKKTVEIYQIMCQLMEDEEHLADKIRLSELEVQDALDTRMKEEAASVLNISVYDTLRNDKAKKHRLELEIQEREDRLQKQEKELDYLGPFLTQLGTPERITRNIAFRLREDCLGDLKQHLIDKANLIQARFEKETSELQKRQAWYQQNQVSMQKDDEQGYLMFCNEAMFRIHILELRLNRHKEFAPLKYMALEQKIRSDPRLSEFL